MCDYYEEILLICNFHPSRARNYATTVVSKFNNFAEVLAVRVHVDVYMATAALRSLTHFFYLKLYQSIREYRNLLKQIYLERDTKTSNRGTNAPDKI